MPPRSMFKARYRPHGMEYASCLRCNNGTSTADLVAAFFARLTPFPEPDPWRTIELTRLNRQIARVAPEVTREVLGDQSRRRQWMPNRQGLLVEQVVLEPRGPVFQAYLAVFGAKIAMALYREHIGEPLPLSGATANFHFLNAGIGQKQADSMLQRLPSRSTLTQGRWTVGDQFSYRFNTDEKGIVAAFCSFQGGLYIFAIATSDPDFYLAPIATAGEALIRPGGLLDALPSEAMLNPRAEARPQSKRLASGLWLGPRA